ncbi:MAG: DUF924 family protein [Aquabacterium sp.]|jgi:uncharacterized protein (DUF924 family)|uniref:DUF924 family protein n=1 Tax=Aquabacterium sp. TaxID=1872578 RepID=UPI003BAE6D84
MTDQPSDVVQWWRETEADWFSHEADFDHRFSARFMALHEAAARGEISNWADTAEGLLALLILLDQFPRNAFRGSARMYATDPLTRDIARRAEAAGHAAQVEARLRPFFLPFTHSEDLADHDQAVRLQTPQGGGALKFAKHHREIIQRFGRFPHRNALLGRPTTPDEQAFLDGGGFKG